MKKIKNLTEFYNAVALISPNNYFQVSAEKSTCQVIIYKVWSMKYPAITFTGNTPEQCIKQFEDRIDCKEEDIEIVTDDVDEEKFSVPLPE